MEKKIAYFILLLSASYTGFSQTPYYDALFLKNNGSIVGNKFEIKINDDNRAQIIEIFKRYINHDFEDLNDEISTIYRNPFISVSGTTRTGGGGAMFSSAVKSAVSSIGGLDVTNIAQGLANFLVERAKEELNVAFFERLKDVLDNYPEFKTLFPYTKVFIDSFESWQYANLLNTLREAFNKDLGNLLGNLIELRELDETIDCSGENIKNKNALNSCKKRIHDLSAFLQTNEGRLVLSALKISDGLAKGQKTPDIINSIASDDFLLGLKFPTNLPLENNLKNSIKLLNILSLSLRSYEVNQHYITKTEFNLLINPALNNDLQKIYLGLIFQQIHNEQIQIDNKDVADIIAKNYNYLLNYLSQLETLSINIQTAYDKILKDVTEAKQGSKLDFIALVNTTTSLLQGAQNIGMISPDLKFPPNLNELLLISNEVLQAVQDIKSGNYEGAIITVMKVLSEQIRKAETSSGNQNQFPETKQFLSALLKYGSFASNVVKAKDPDEVKDAIKSIALPAGSASIKKHSNFNVSLNAYVGLVGGKDKPNHKSYEVTNADGTKTTVKLNGGRALSVYAPIGINLNWGLGWKTCKNPWSLSAAFSLIDVGALVGYRFTNDSTYTNTPNVKVANIFAPGVNLAIGLPGVPISIGVGGQRISTLQRNPGSNEVYNVDFSGWRYPQFFIAVDIPLINLFTGKKTLLNTRTQKKK